MTTSDINKVTECQSLYKLLSPRLHENERLLNNQTAFHKSCEHWNQRDISGIRAVTNAKNPWLRFKKEFEQALQMEELKAVIAIEKSLAWFGQERYNDAWIQD